MEDRSLLASCNTDIPPCPKLYGRYFRKKERREADLVIRVSHSQERSQELREEEEVTQEPALTQVRDWHEH